MASGAAWPYPRIIAHRGGGALAPENTFAGLRKAHALGFRAVEFDVMLTADSVPILMHDERLERTTDGQGAVAARSRASLATLDAGAWLDASFRGERIPTLDSAAQLCRSLGLWANVEIKPTTGRARDTGRLAALSAASAWRDAVPAPLLSSFEIGALEAARAAAPALPRGLLVEHVPDDWRALVAQLGCVSLHCSRQAASQDLVREVHAAGCALLCWTVNDEDTAHRLFAWDVDALFTDRLDLIGADFAQRRPGGD